MHHRWQILALLVSAMVLAGCAGGDEDPPVTTTPTGTPPTGTTTTTPTTTTPGGGTPPPQTPEPTVVTDSGTIQGPFEREWAIPVAVVSPRALNVNFNLTGAQPGAPPTARVHLEFLSPDGAVLKSAGVGLGEAGGSIAWSFSAADIPAAGEYKLRATQSAAPAGPTGLPSGGVGNYQLFAVVEY